MKSYNVFGNHFAEVLVTLTAALCMVSVGLTMGWAGPALSALTTKPDAPFTILPEQSTILATIMYIGIMLGAIMTYVLSDHIGRSKFLWFTSIPFLISFLIFSFGQKLHLFYLARFLSGFATGISFGIAPLYVCEIAPKQIRGGLSLLLQVTSGVGMSASYVIIPFFSLTVFGIVSFVVAVSHFILSCFIPESPYFLLLQRDNLRAELELKKIRNSDDVSVEFVELLDHVSAKLSEPPISLRFIYGECRRQILLTSLLMVAQQSSGAAAMMAFSQEIFDTGRIVISSDVCGIIYCCFSISFTLICGTFVDKIGRKVLFQTSSIMVIFPLIAFGMYYYLQKIEVIEENRWPYLPLFFMLWHVSVSALGLGPLPYLISNEIIPTRIRPLGGCILTVISTIGGTVTTISFKALDEAYGKYAPLWAFAVVMTFLSILIVKILPETKGKSFDQIEELFKTKKIKHIT